VEQWAELRREHFVVGKSIKRLVRETGLSKDVLRMWERRYGFPKPARDDNGERQYTVGETAKLRAIKRLMETGVRPGKVIGLSLDQLNALADARAPLPRDAAPAMERDVLSMLKLHDATALQHALAQWLMRQGLQRFVVETLAPLNRLVGEAWMRGDLHVFEEHLYTEQVQGSLRTAINTFPRQVGHPRVLLTTLPIESFVDAERLVRWYTYRWRIERYHFTLKSGCRLEELQLETAERLRRALSLYALVACRLLHLTYLAREEPWGSCERVLSREEWEVLWRHHFPGKPLPAAAPGLREAVVWVARLGGFLGRKHDGEPGVKVLWRGLRKLQAMVIGFRLGKVATHSEQSSD